MEKSVYALTEHEAFVRELLALYKERPMLWRPTHPAYRNRNERAKAYEQLVKKTQEYYPEADEDFVKMKIDSMRSCFRKERRKVLYSKENCSNPDEIYKPSLWYYDLLLFTAGEEVENGLNGVKTEGVHQVTSRERGNSVKVPAVWNRKHSAILINLYKRNPCLYSESHPFYRSQKKRNEALKKITEKLITVTGKFFHVEDVRRKISLLRSQFLQECKRVNKSESTGGVYTSNLWCFEMLGFLKDRNLIKECSPVRQTENMNLPRRLNGRRNTSVDTSGEDENIKIESDLNELGDSGHIETSHDVEDEDIFVTIAKNLAHQLRGMEEQQRNIANKIIREVMYHGQMEHLTVGSRFSLDGS